MRRLIAILLAVGLLAAWAMPVAALSEGCPWGEESPPTCEFVAAGSTVVASMAEIHTQSAASITTAPPAELQHHG